MIRNYMFFRKTPMFAFAPGVPSSAVQAMSAQFALQCATFDVLLRKVGEHQVRLAAMQAAVARLTPAGRQCEVISLVRVRLQIEIRYLREQTARFAAQVQSVDAGVHDTGANLIAETQDRVVDMVALATRSNGVCAPAMMRAIKGAIDRANIEIERIRQCMALVSRDALELENQLRR